MRYLNFSELRTKLGGRSRSACYVDLAEGRLPQPIKLGGRLYWPESDVDAHLRAMLPQAETGSAKNGAGTGGAA